MSSPQMPYPPAPAPPQPSTPKAGRRNPLARAGGIAVAVLVVVALAYSVYAVTAAHDDITTLKHQATTLQGEVKTDNTQASTQLSTFGANLANDESKLSTAASSINTLNQPTSDIRLIAL